MKTQTPIWISILLFFFYVNISLAQVTTTISAGASWTDATLTKSLNLPSEAYLQTTNYNSYPRIDATVWTHSGQQITYRNLLRFDLTAIPVNATIQSANLFLYSDPTYTSGPGSNSGSNAFFLQKVTTGWSPTGVTWDTQPTTTTVNRVYVPASASATENITVSLTSMIQNMVLNPSTNFGMMMMLENEITYESRNYASSDHTNTAIRPKIVITYTQVTPPDTSTFSKKIDYTIQFIDKTKIPTGILYDRVFPAAGLNTFNQVGRQDTSSYNHFIQSYSEINNSSYRQNTSPSVDMFKNLILKNRNGINIPIGLLNYEFNIIDTLSIVNNQFIINGKFLKDVAGRSTSPYLYRKVLVISQMADYLKTGTVNFKFPSDLYWQNASPIISSLQITAGDNNQVATLTPDGPSVSFNYNTSGIKTVKFVVTFSDNTTKTTYSSLLVGQTSN